MALSLGTLSQITDSNLLFTALLWYLNFGLTVVAFAIAIPTSFFSFNTVKAVMHLPMAFSRMLVLLFKLKGANNQFIHTSHGNINK